MIVQNANQAGVDVTAPQCPHDLRKIKIKNYIYNIRMFLLIILILTTIGISLTVHGYNQMNEWVKNKCLVRNVTYHLKAYKSWVLAVGDFDVSVSGITTTFTTDYDCVDEFDIPNLFSKCPKIGEEIECYVRKNKIVSGYIPYSGFYYSGSIILIMSAAMFSAIIIQISLYAIFPKTCT